MSVENELYFDKLNFDPATADVIGTGDKLLTQEAPTINDTELTGTTLVPTGSNITITDAPVAGTDGANKDYVDSVAGTAVDVPQWHKYTKTYADLSTAANTNSIELVSLPARAVISGLKVKHSTAFSGGTVSAYTVKVGITGALTRLSKAFDVFQAVAATTLKTVNTAMAFDEGSVTSIKLTADSVGDTLDNATAGSVTVWILYAVPAA